MEITYLGKSSCKIKSKTGTVVLEPYGKSEGVMSFVAADVVTVSKKMDDKTDRVVKITKTSRRKAPFIIDEPGEYEIEGISIFGYKTEESVMYLVHAEELRILHVASLGKMIGGKLLDKLDGVDVVIVPSGADSQVSPEIAVELASKLEASYTVLLTTEKESVETKKFLEGYSKTTREVKALNVTKAGILGDASEVITFI